MSGIGGVGAVVRGAGVRSLAAALALLGVVSCGRPFGVVTPSEFVELEAKEEDAYAYRAVSADGVVVAVRAIELKGRGSVSFWERAITLELRDASGYALLGAEDVETHHGSQGRLLTFGRDDGRKTYRYRVAIFVEQGRLFVVEAGGEEAAMQRYEAKLAWQLDNFRGRCDHWLAPVLASRTCNRW